MDGHNESYRNNSDKVIFSEKNILERVSEIGQQITKDYYDKQEDGIVVVGVLKGAAIFMADLVRNIDLKIELDFIHASSYYDNFESSGKLNLEKDISCDIKDKHVILVEDIIDSGITVGSISKHLSDKKPASITICALLNKNVSTADITVKYCCFDCPDEFIVGYGLDAAQIYRNLPYISSYKMQEKD